MGKNYEGYLDSKEALRHYCSYGELPLYIPGHIESKIERLKHSKHSDNYIKERIRIYKHLYCKLADSEKLRSHSRNFSPVKSGQVPDDIESEVRRIIKEAEDLLHKTRDIDTYHHESAHLWENQDILWTFKCYLSAVYGIPITMNTQHKKTLWKSFRESFKFR